jgi:hypothetical protein
MKFKKMNISKSLTLVFTLLLLFPIFSEAQVEPLPFSRYQTMSNHQIHPGSAIQIKPLKKSVSSFPLYTNRIPGSDYTLSDLSVKSFSEYSISNLMLSPQNNNSMFSNRRLKYSSLWAFTSLNYLYADLVGLMDVNLLNQYQTGIVNGVEITPGFLTAAAAYMQLPLANVFLPHVIKNDKALRWVQIISGSIATLVQGATLFVGEPSPYYILFSAIEIGATAYITIDAIKWKPGKR